MRGQIFTLDAFMALVAVTAVLGYATMQFENIYSQSHDLEYQKLQTLADDISQIALKTTQTGSFVDSPNIVDAGSLDRLKTKIDTTPYSYEVILAGTTTANLNDGACQGKSDIAVTRRIISTGTLTVKVCL